MMKASTISRFNSLHKSRTHTIIDKGLVTLTENLHFEDWNNFEDTMDCIEDLVSANSQYSITENIVDIIETLFFRDRIFSKEEIDGFLYTIGRLFTYYDQENEVWVYQGEEGFEDIFNIVKYRLPAIHSILQTGNGEKYRALLSVNSEIMQKDGLIEYLSKNRICI